MRVCVDNESGVRFFMRLALAFINRKGRKKDKTDGGSGDGAATPTTAGGPGGGGGGTATTTMTTTGEDCSKLYLHHVHLQRFVKNHHLRQIIPLPPEIDLNEWLASQSKSLDIDTLYGVLWIFSVVAVWQYLA